MLKATAIGAVMMIALAQAIAVAVATALEEHAEKSMRFLIVKLMIN